MTPRPKHVTVIADTTPGPHRTDSDDAFWWLPILGPSASWLAVLLARHASIQTETCWDTATLARMVGLGANRYKLWVSLDRLDYYRAARFVTTDTLTIRLWLPALGHRLVERLPEPLAAAYLHELGRERHV